MLIAEYTAEPSMYQRTGDGQQCRSGHAEHKGRQGKEHWAGSQKGYPQMSHLASWTPLSSSLRWGCSFPTLHYSQGCYPESWEKMYDSFLQRIVQGVVGITARFHPSFQESCTGTFLNHHQWCTCAGPAGFPKQPSNLIKTVFPYTPWASPSFVRLCFFFISDKLQLQITFQTFKMTGKVCPCLGPWRPHVLVRLSALYWCCPRSPSVGISFSFMGGSPVSRLTMRFPEPSVLSFMHASCIQHSLLSQLAQRTACKSAWSAWCWDLSGSASSTLILFWDGAEYSEHLQS